MHPIPAETTVCETALPFPTHPRMPTPRGGAPHHTSPTAPPAQHQPQLYWNPPLQQAPQHYAPGYSPPPPTTVYVPLYNPLVEEILQQPVDLDAGTSIKADGHNEYHAKKNEKLLEGCTPNEASSYGTRAKKKFITDALFAKVKEIERDKQTLANEVHRGRAWMRIMQQELRRIDHNHNSFLNLVANELHEVFALNSGQISNMDSARLPSPDIRNPTLLNEADEYILAA